MDAHRREVRPERRLHLGEQRLGKRAAAVAGKPELDRGDFEIILAAKALDRLRLRPEGWRRCARRARGRGALQRLGRLQPRHRAHLPADEETLDYPSGHKDSENWSATIYAVSTILAMPNEEGMKSPA